MVGLAACARRWGGGEGKVPNVSGVEIGITSAFELFDH